MHIFCEIQRILEGERPSSLDELLLSIWWGCIAALVVLLFLKWKSEKVGEVHYKQLRHTKTIRSDFSDGFSTPSQVLRDLGEL
ncbi:hypothetical protein GCM10010913_12410 [Paenibacillus aceti]|uniref:Uncharacterized protein n=1 Tax=Paenibacillus aceti TaxID=1820010 RepID=A0ABQ1VS15_9BACL|nr:hypothetical protein GCM10010913_12410 [Paenibacillus aceti]